MTPRLIGMKQAAAYLGVSVSMFRSLKISSVQMPNAKGDGTIRKPLYDIRRLDAFIDSMEGAWQEGRKVQSSKEKAVIAFTPHQSSGSSNQNPQKHNLSRKQQKSSDPELTKLKEDYGLTHLK